MDAERELSDRRHALRPVDNNVLNVMKSEAAITLDASGLPTTTSMH